MAATASALAQAVVDAGILRIDGSVIADTGPFERDWWAVVGGDCPADESLHRLVRERGSGGSHTTGTARGRLVHGDCGGSESGDRQAAIAPAPGSLPGRDDPLGSLMRIWPG
jgi:hypothetical protein